MRNTLLTKTFVRFGAEEQCGKQLNKSDHTDSRVDCTRCRILET